ncbi:MAG: hypothetical protein K6F53_07205 [Lachnospiraceae bacterium]|nr:hypothetical protein [Lachnospiraceae bacterium]
MKKKFANVSNRIRLSGQRRMHGSREVIDFYLVHPVYGREYAFTRKYTRGTYEIVKGGIPIKDLLCLRSKDTMIMRLVEYTSLMMPYFMEEISWMAA